MLEEVYRPLFINKSPMMLTSRRAAELIKYAANAFLATKISFINQISDICEKAGADVQDVARGMGLYNRIGTKFLHAGPGYGGSCFPKDTQALVKTARDFGSSIPIVEAVVAYNETRKRQMVDKIVTACGGDIAGKTIALLGLAFKPNTDDMRDSPSIEISQGLLALGANVRAFDPESMIQAKPLLGNVTYCEGAYHCVEGADAAVIVTEWDAFRALDLSRAKSLMRQPIIVDLRNIYRPDAVRELGFTYASIGRARFQSEGNKHV